MRTMSVNSDEPLLPFDAVERKKELACRPLYLKLELGAITTVLAGSSICTALAVARMVKILLGGELNVMVETQRGLNFVVQNITLVLDDSEKESLRQNQTMAIVGAVFICVSVGILYLGAVRRALE